MVYDFSRILVPKDFLVYFEIIEVIEKGNEWQIVLHEKKDQIPKALLSETMVVLDGFCNPLNLLSHSFSLKPVYLVMYRRRWKVSNTDKHYSNEYTLTKDSAKLTADMAVFLKV